MKYIGIFRQYNGNSCLCKRNCHYWKHLQGNWRSTIQGVKWVQLLQSKFLATENQFQNLWLIHLGVMIFKRKYQALVKVKNFAKSFLTIFRGLFWAVTNGQNSDIFFILWSISSHDPLSLQRLSIKVWNWMCSCLQMQTKLWDHGWLLQRLIESWQFEFGPFKQK